MHAFSLIRQRSYGRLLAANFLSGIGDWFNSVAVLSLLLQLTGTSMAVGITLALRTLPYLIFGPIGGKLADKYNRKTILIVCDVVRSLLALFFLLVSSSADIWIIYVGTFLLIAFSALYNPARTAIIPQLVDEKEVASANALEQSVFGTVMAVGSLVGGVFTSLWGTELAFVFNSLSFAASALLIASVTVPPRTDTHKEEARSDHASFHELLPVFANKPLVPLILSFSMLWPIGGGIINVLISVYAYQVFEAGNTGIGLLYAAIGVGFLLGGLLTDVLRKWTYQTACLSIPAEGVAHILISGSTSLYGAAALFCLSTVAGGMGNASLNTLLMQHVPNRYHGRIFALESTCSGVVTGCSMLVGGWLLAYASPRTVGFLSGLFITLTSACIGLAMWRLRSRAQSLPVQTKNHA